MRVPIDNTRQYLTTISAVVLCVYLLTSTACLWTGGASQRADVVIKLAADCLFRTDPRKIGVQERWFATDLDCRDWKSFLTEQPWDGLGYLDYIGDAWYRIPIQFSAETMSQRRQVLLRFTGVDDSCVIFLNGRQIGDFQGWDDTFDVKIPPSLFQTGRTNILAVLVHNEWGPGGIWRPVYVVLTDEDFSSIKPTR